MLQHNRLQEIPSGSPARLQRRSVKKIFAVVKSIFNRSIYHIYIYDMMFVYL